MCKRTNYYIRQINGNKVDLEEALEMFEIKYKKLLKFKYVSQVAGLDLIDVVENNHYISKSLSIKILNGKIFWKYLMKMRKKIMNIIII
ncbi:hypothetical protein JMUB5056_1131 [Leptotrichia hongkongensis]|uniref:Uncharacterized protein n=1 Tax=Leptotrichia hongkongensis TaxID=554406 RepID=A0A510L7E1_9FUSO|nr:hypothetical protein JMUB5056_1131 [Leptotrichia hongkongensis]